MLCCKRTTWAVYSPLSLQSPSSTPPGSPRHLPRLEMTRHSQVCRFLSVFVPFFIMHIIDTVNNVSVGLMLQLQVKSQWNMLKLPKQPNASPVRSLIWIWCGMPHFLLISAVSYYKPQSIILNHWKFHLYFSSKIPSWKQNLRNKSVMSHLTILKIKS